MEVQYYNAKTASVSQDICYDNECLWKCQPGVRASNSNE